MIMPFGWEGGTQVTVTLRGWSSDTTGVSTGPGPEGKEKQNREMKKICSKQQWINVLPVCVLIKRGRGE